MVKKNLGEEYKTKKQSYEHPGNCELFGKTIFKKKPEVTENPCEKRSCLDDFSIKVEV